MAVYSRCSLTAIFVTHPNGFESEFRILNEN